jgi:hypothetical protein
MGFAFLFLDEEHEIKVIAIKIEVMYFMYGQRLMS